MDYFCKSDLKKRGWTDRLIKKLLGEPDARRTNPHCRGGEPMRLYREGRVEQAEKHPDFFARRVKLAQQNAPKS